MSPHLVLQIENNAANAFLVEELIARRSDLKLVSATKGYQGIEIARTCHPDLILMDINLYDIHGIEALKLLRNDPETACIPVIALSSDAHPQKISDGLEAGFFRYLTKPFKIAELMATIDIALDFVEKSRFTKST